MTNDPDHCAACGERLRMVGALGVGRLDGDTYRYMLCPPCSERAARDPEGIADAVELRLRRAGGHA